MSAILFTASIVSQIIQRADGLSHLYIFCSVSLRRPIISLIALGKISLFSFLYLIINVDFISIWYTENSNVFDCLNKLTPSSSSPNSFFLSPSLSILPKKAWFFHVGSTGTSLGLRYSLLMGNWITTFPQLYTIRFHMMYLSIAHTMAGIRCRRVLIHW